MNDVNNDIYYKKDTFEGFKTHTAKDALQLFKHFKVFIGIAKVKTNIEDFFRIRFIMYKDVYNHHTVRGIEFMMKDYIEIYKDIFVHSYFGNGGIIFKFFKK